MPATADSAASEIGTHVRATTFITRSRDGRFRPSGARGLNLRR